LTTSLQNNLWAPENIWRPQSFHNDCFVACLRMLLACEGVGASVGEITRDCLMGEILRKNDDAYECGFTADQSAPVINRFLTPKGWRFCEARPDTPEAYFSQIRAVIASGSPLIASFPRTALPGALPGASGRHAMVVCKVDESALWVLNPEPDQNASFDRVFLPLFYDRLMDEWSRMGAPYPLSIIQPADGEEALASDRELLETSLTALKGYGNLVSDTISAGSDPSRIDFALNHLVKPFARDLRVTALAAGIEADWLNLLDRCWRHAMTTHKEMVDGITPNRLDLDRFGEFAGGIEAALTTHLQSRLDQIPGGVRIITA
jgi:hypothetical protein